MKVQKEFKLFLIQSLSLFLILSKLESQLYFLQNKIKHAVLLKTSVNNCFIKYSN